MDSQVALQSGGRHEFGDMTCLPTKSVEMTLTGKFNTSSDRIVDIPTTLHTDSSVFDVRDACQLETQV